MTPVGLHAIEVRPRVAGDEGFLRHLHAEARAAEFVVLGWPSAQLRAFLDEQWRVREAALLQAHPDMVDTVVELDGQSVGRLATSRSSTEVRLVDLGVAAAHRRRGIATAVLDDLFASAAAAGLDVTLHVRVGNPARLLYERMGFVVEHDGGTDVRMRWAPPQIGGVGAATAALR